MYGYGNSMFLATHGILARANAAVLPVNTVAPAITGTAQEGQTVTCSTGTWTGTPTITYAYQWKRNGSNIGSATSSTYLLVSADVAQSITCQVTATNGAGSASATSNTITPIAAFTGLLDTYSGAAAAYSLRRLSTSYTSNLIRVRRSSDNTEQDFGYNANNVLDTAALLTFCGAGNGFVTTWYDQSGNARNSTQSTAANQPQIVSSGAMINESSKPTLQFDGSNDRMTNSTINISQPITRFIVGKTTATGGGLPDTFADSNDASNRFAIYRGSDGSLYSSYSNAGTQMSTTGNTNRNLMYELGDNTTSVIAINGATGTSGNIGTNGLNGLTIGDLRISGIGYILQGNIQEMIIYGSNQSTNRTGIESNINTFYSIY
jgi:hypothetical protein